MRNKILLGVALAAMLSAQTHKVTDAEVKDLAQTASKLFDGNGLLRPGRVVENDIGSIQLARGGDG